MNRYNDWLKRYNGSVNRYNVSYFLKIFKNFPPGSHQINTRTRRTR
jgi:hypothetical protein